MERRQRTEATLRDALAQGQEDIRYRDFLVPEVNHRTKNALQLAVSLLGVQARHVDDPSCRSASETALGRLSRVGEVHALLTYGSGSPDVIDCADYLRRLCREMEESLAPSGGRVTVEVDAEEEAVWPPDLIPRSSSRPLDQSATGKVMVNLAPAPLLFVPKVSRPPSWPTREEITRMPRPLVAPGS